MTLKFVVSGIAIAALAGCASSQPQARGSSSTGGSDSRIVMTPEISHALDTAVRNQPQAWTDPESGAQTSFTVLSIIQKEDDTYCREFTETVSKGSDTETFKGIACRNADGSWRVGAG